MTTFEAPPASEEHIAEAAGSRIGRFKLLQKIGEGGFGVVFMAEQQEPVRRKVALKIIKRGMDTKEVIARFEAEQQALALVEHPNIARVFDGGETATGRPFFAMELVKGVPQGASRRYVHGKPRCHSPTASAMSLTKSAIPSILTSPSERDAPPKSSTVVHPSLTYRVS